uniref:ENTH domain-containing protein n=1 Tax=Peronospora matthiolae TaxID=2874970 RepID=A0AAV1UN00_9STRA
MNRHALAEATSLHDGPVPVYLMEEIAHSTKASDRDAEKTADFMLARLHKSNLNVKLKALQIISCCIRDGSRAFAEVIRDKEQEVAVYLQISGLSDPVYGDEKYRRIRVAAQEALVCLNVSFLSRQQEEPQQHALQGNDESWHASTRDNVPAYGTADSACDQTERQHMSVGGSWGQQQPSGRPMPYQDNPSEGYNRPSDGGYNGPPGVGRSGPPGGEGNRGFGSDTNNFGQNGGSMGGYGTTQNCPQSTYGHSTQAPQPPQRQATGFDSWSTHPGSGMASKSTGAGTWSSSGYQKKDLAVDNEPRYNPSVRRDNRPTVLVGHALNFPKPAGAYGNSTMDVTSGLGGFQSGTYNSNAVRSASGATAFNPNLIEGSAPGGFAGHHQLGGAPSYADATSRIGGSAHRIGSMGLPVNGQPLPDAPSTALGKKAEVLKKLGTAALEKWDRRNMDKSMVSSLADHDELRAGPQIVEHGYYQSNARQGAGGGDTSRDYERTMIDNLCAPAGLSRAPPADGLKRFVDLAQTLDSQTIGDIVLDKLEDETWQVRLKGLHVVRALLDSPGAAVYEEFFEENVEVIEELLKDAKSSVVSKALQVLRALGYADDAYEAPKPSSKRVGATRFQRGSSPNKRVQQEVDLLGFDSLSLESPASPVGHGGTGSVDLLGSPVCPLPPPALTSMQEVLLLGDYNTLERSGPPYAPQQQQAVPKMYEQFEQARVEEHIKTSSHYGKDLFSVVDSPCSTGTSIGTASRAGAVDNVCLSGNRSAFTFM